MEAAKGLVLTGEDAGEKAELEDDSAGKGPEGDEGLNDSVKDDVVLSFGRHKGRTLREVNESDPSYIDWLCANAREEEVRNASKMLIESRKE